MAELAVSQVGRRLSRERGFTLIETMVAVALLAVMSVMAFQATEAVLAVNERSRNDLVEETRLQRCWQIISADLLHIRPRPFADGFGGYEPAYYTGVDGTDFLLRLSRGGGAMLQSNPGGVLRIDYYIDSDKQLVRATRPVTSSRQADQRREQVLLTGVQTLIFEQLSDGNEYSASWPPLNEQHSLRSLPKMIRVTLMMSDGTQTQRVLPGVVSSD